MKLVIMWLILALALVACGSEATTEPTLAPLAVIDTTPEAPTASPTQNITQTPAVIATTPAPTNRPASNTNNAAVSSTCTPRTDWVMTYTVKQGETLSSLADWAATTVDILAQGNCITDPNQLQVGQVIRVPIVPSATPVGYISPTPFPTGGTPPQIISFSSNVTEAATGETVALTWQVQGADQGIYLRREYRDSTITTAQAPQDWENLAASGTQTITFGNIAQERYILTAYGQNQVIRQEIDVTLKGGTVKIPIEIISFTGTITADNQISLVWEVVGSDLTAVSLRTVLSDQSPGEWFNNQPLKGSLTIPIPTGATNNISFSLIPIMSDGQGTLPDRVIQTGKHQVTLSLP